MKFRKINNKEEWKSTINKTVIRKRSPYDMVPNGKIYELWNGYRQWAWFATLEEAKAFAANNFRFNRAER